MGTIARLNEAKKKRNEAQSQMPGAYENSYADSVKQKLGQLAQANAGFAADGLSGADAGALGQAYQQYRAKAVQNAKGGAAAAADTAGALGGGYGTDWAGSAAGQAAGEQVAGIDNSLSGLRAEALQNWKNAQNDTSSILNDLLGQQSLERSEYDSGVTNAQNWRDYLTGRVDTARQENENFWNNVWNTAKGLGGAVWNGYQNYEKYGQQKATMQAQGMELAQNAYEAGDPERARAYLKIYGLDEGMVDNWTESYNVRQNKVTGLTKGIELLKAGASKETVGRMLEQYGLDATALDSWQGMTDYQKEQLDAALNAMSAMSDGQETGAGTILSLAGMDKNAIDDYGTVSKRQNDTELARAEALQKMQNKYNLAYNTALLREQAKYSKSGSGSSTGSKSSGKSSAADGLTFTQLNTVRKEFDSMEPGDAGYDAYRQILLDAGYLADDSSTSGTGTGTTGTGKTAGKTWTTAANSTSKNTESTSKLPYSRKYPWQSTASADGIAGASPSMTGTNHQSGSLDSALNIAQQMEAQGYEVQAIVERLMRQNYTDDTISKVSNVMGW